MSDDQESQNNSIDAVKAATETALANNAVVNGEINEVAKKIAESRNVLVALSSDPSVDELAAAIGTSIFLDNAGKRTTVIYSGQTPNALEFLKPEEIFDTSADVLQDFVIALNKDKADHLRYKLDGDYVKIYITPYKSKIEESDLDFSYGDYNVDLVIALDVANGIDLDEALREHGRIMHDAIIINITTGKPGKFGEIEVSRPKASSISEIMAGLAYIMSEKQGIGKDEATAFLTGIVAATNRFSNARTTAVTMRMASRLMESGANQQLVSKNITPDVDNKMFSDEISINDAKADEFGIEEAEETKSDDDSNKLEINHGDENDDVAKVEDATKEELSKDDIQSTGDTALLDDLRAAEAALSSAGSETVSKPGEVLPGVEVEDDESAKGESSVTAEEPINEEAPISEPVQQPDENDNEAEAVEDEAVENESVEDETTPNVEEAAPVDTPVEEPEKVTGSGYLTENLAEQTEKVIPGPQIPTPGSSIPRKEVVVTPPENLSASELSNPEPSKFEQMMAEALGEGSNPAAAMAPKVEPEPVIEVMPAVDYGQVNGELVQPKAAATAQDGILPPPPAPAMPASMMADMSNVEMPPAVPSVEMPPVAMPTVDATATLPDDNAQTMAPMPAPAAPAVEVPSDPAAFKIPGVN